MNNPINNNAPAGAQPPDHAAPPFCFKHALMLCAFTQSLHAAWHSAILGAARQREKGGHEPCIRGGWAKATRRAGPAWGVGLWGIESRLRRPTTNHLDWRHKAISHQTRQKAGERKPSIRGGRRLANQSGMQQVRQAPCSPGAWPPAARVSAAGPILSHLRLQPG